MELFKVPSANFQASSPVLVGIPEIVKNHKSLGNYMYNNWIIPIIPHLLFEHWNLSPKTKHTEGSNGGLESCKSKASKKAKGTYIREAFYSGLWTDTKTQEKIFKVIKDFWLTIND